MKKRLFLGLLIGTLLIAGGFSLALPNSDSGAILMIPHTSERYGFSSVVPWGWSDVGGGEFRRGDSSEDLYTAIMQRSYPDMGISEVLAEGCSQIGFEGTPESIGSYRGSNYTWDIYSVEVEIPEVGPFVAKVALTASNGTTHMVGLMVPAEVYESDEPMLDVIFTHAMYAYAPYAWSGEVEMVPFTNEEIGVRSVSPAGWVEVEPGVFARAGGPSDHTALAYRSFPGQSKEDVMTLTPQESEMVESAVASGKYEAGALIWDLYRMELNVPEVGSLTERFALAEVDSTTYAVVVLALTEDYGLSAEMLDAVFVEALDAFERLE